MGGAAQSGGGGAMMGGASMGGSQQFSGASMGGGAQFSGASMGGAQFSGASMGGGQQFSGASMGGGQMMGAEMGGQMGGGADDQAEWQNAVDLRVSTQKVTVPCTRNTYKQYTVKVPRVVREKVPRTVKYVDMEKRTKTVPYTVNRTETRYRNSD